MTLKEIESKLKLMCELRPYLSQKNKRSNDSIMVCDFIYKNKPFSISTGYYFGDLIYGFLTYDSRGFQYYKNRFGSIPEVLAAIKEMTG